MTGLGGLAIGGVGALPGIGFLSVDGEQVEGGGAVFGGWAGVAAIKTAQRPLMDHTTGTTGTTGHTTGTTGTTGNRRNRR